MSLTDPRTRALWLFSEQYHSVLPRDASGHLPPLAAGGLALPGVVSGTLSGFGRLFTAEDSAETGLEAPDASDALDLTRELTVIALLSLDLEEQEAAGAGVVVQLGRGKVAARLELEVLNLGNRQVRMRLVWNDEVGAPVADAGATFTWPDHDDAFLYLAAVREVVAGEIVCRYQVQGDSVDGDAHDLDVESKDGQDVLVGAGHDGTDPEAHFCGVLDVLEVGAEAVSREELRWIWERLAIDLPAGVATMRRMVPPGVYSQDPESAVQLELASEGRGFGLVKSLARRLRDYSRPDVAWGRALEAWEAVTQHSPRPGDTLATRRGRVVSFLGTILGFALEDLREQVRLTFDLPAEDVELIEYSNDLARDFTEDPADYIQVDGDGTWTVGSGKAAFAATAKDLRFGGAQDAAGWLLWSVAHPLQALVAAEVKVVSGDANSLSGILVGNKVANEWLIVGLNNDSPRDLVYVLFSGGTPAAAQVLEADVADTLHVRVRHTGDGSYRVTWGANEAAAIHATPSVIAGGPAEPQWAGFAATTEDDDDSVTVAAEMTDLLIRTPNGRQRFNWYAFRAPALDGDPDIRGARLTIQRIRPSHTRGQVITSRQLVCGDAENGVGIAPLGEP